MESRNHQNEAKLISYCFSNKTQNILRKNKVNKKLQSSSNTLLKIKKSTNNLNTSTLKSILHENEKKLVSKTINDISDKNITLNIKANYSLCKVINIKDNENTNKKPKNYNKIHTINVYIGAQTKYKNNLKKSKTIKGTQLIHNKKISPKNNNRNKTNYSKTPIKYNIIKYYPKTTNKNTLYLNKNKNETRNRNKIKISKSMLEKTTNTYKNNDKTYYKTIAYNNINLNSVNKNNSLNNNIKMNKNNMEDPNQNKKILVIDLDETLMHTSFQKIENPDLIIKLYSNINKKDEKEKDNNDNKETNSKFIEAFVRIRPGVDQFLSQMSKYYDIYVYSASSKNYLNSIIKNIDKNNIIKKCFCRDDCIKYVEDHEEDFDKPNDKFNYVKDLKKINKELRNIVFIDNNAISFKLQEKNGIPIKSWFDDYEDIELYKLIPILKNLSGFYDVRIEISKFVQNKTFIWSKSIKWLMENCLNSSYLNEINSVLLKEQQKSVIHFDDYNERNEPKVINNINNILISLNKSNNKLKNNISKYINEKTNSFFKKINTNFENYKKNIKNENYKNINNDKFSLENNFKLSNIKISNKKINNCDINLSQKLQKNLFKKRVEKSKLKNNSLFEEYKMYFSNNNSN